MLKLHKTHNLAIIVSQADSSSMDFYIFILVLIL